METARFTGTKRHAISSPACPPPRPSLFNAELNRYPCRVRLLRAFLIKPRSRFHGERQNRERAAELSTACSCHRSHDLVWPRLAERNAGPYIFFFPETRKSSARKRVNDDSRAGSFTEGWQGGWNIARRGRYLQELCREGGGGGKSELINYSRSVSGSLVLSRLQTITLMP